MRSSTQEVVVLYREKFVFVVDDTFDDLHLISFYLQGKWGVGRVKTASDGREALVKLNDLVSSRSKLPDLILTDLNMTPMKGDSFIDALVSNDELKNIPVVLMSGASPEFVNDIELSKSGDLRADIGKVLSKYL